jgi:hypothetical protein
VSTPATTQDSYKAFFKDLTGVPLNAYTLPDSPSSPPAPKDGLVEDTHVPHAIELEWEDWNNTK